MLDDVGWCWSSEAESSQFRTMASAPCDFRKNSQAPPSPGRVTLKAWKNVTTSPGMWRACVFWGRKMGQNSRLRIFHAEQVWIVPNTFIEFHSSLIPLHPSNGELINGNSRILNWRYLPYIRPIFQAYVSEYPSKIWPYMVQYLHFRILKFPLTNATRENPSTTSWGWSQLIAVETSGCWLNQQPDPARFEAHIMLYHVISYPKFPLWNLHVP
jgi:hypothetical protein